VRFLIHLPLLCLLPLVGWAQSSLPPCPTGPKAYRHNCFGSLTFTDGASYVGEFKAGDYNGQGIYTFSDGRKYVGEFKDGNYNGQGTYTFSDGRKYVGEFKDDRPNGQGIEYRPDGSVLRSGQWTHGNLTQSYALDGARFPFSPAQEQADIGAITFPDGAKYVGELRRGVRHGEGIYYSSSGVALRQGRWEDDLLVQSFAVDTNRFPFSGTAQATVSQMASPPGEKVIVGQQATVRIPIENFPRGNKCNIAVYFPNQQRIDVEVVGPDFVAVVNYRPTKAGEDALRWEGRTIWRGLNTIFSCPGMGVVKVAIHPNNELLATEWKEHFSRISLDQRDCIVFGMNRGNLKYETSQLHPDENITSREDTKMDPIYETCRNFLSQEHPSREPVPCTILNNIKTTCDGVYAWRGADGRLSRISREDAIRNQFNGWPWTIGLVENSVAQYQRLQLEKEERQRQAEANRQAAAAAAEASRQAAAAAAEASRQAEESDRRWRESPEYKRRQAEARAAQSPLPPCPPEGRWDNCFGIHADGVGNRGTYVGEYRNGRANGKGSWSFPSGNKYIGEFRDDQFHGQGTYTFSDGQKHVGEFRFGRFPMPPVVLAQNSILSSPQEVKPTSHYCQRVKSLSQRLSEDLARTLKVSISSLQVIRSEPGGIGGECEVTIDSSRGPVRCDASWVYSDGQSFWAHGLSAYCSRN